MSGFFNTTDAGGKLTEEALRRAWDALWGQGCDAPPRLSHIYATHSVAYGRVYRMWTTRGELIAYVNRGELADMPRSKTAPSPLAGIVGIPVVFE